LRTEFRHAAHHYNAAAQALGVGRTTIYDLIRQGRLEKIKLGRRSLVTISSIRRLVEGG
jgi:excisionase family DNA binding protein